MKPFLVAVFAFLFVGCMSWKSAINSNTLIGEDRTPIDGEVFYRGSVDASEAVMYYMQSGGRLIRLNFDLSVRRVSGRVWLQFSRADFNGYEFVKFQDLVQGDYVAESRENQSFGTDFMRHPIDSETIETLLRAQPVDRETDERTLLEILSLLLKFVALENLNPKPYAGNQSLAYAEVPLFGYTFAMTSKSTIHGERMAFFDLEVETQLSASYFHKFPEKDGPLKKASGVYYSIGGSDRSTGSYHIGTMLPKSLNVNFNLNGFQQTYFADRDGLYYLEPTRVQVRVSLEEVKVSE